MSKTWEQQPGETDKAYGAFQIFADLGPSRTIEDAWRLYRERNGLKSKRKPRGFSNWVADHRWAERARDQDAAELEGAALAGGSETAGALSQAREIAILALPELMQSAVDRARVEGDHKMYMDLCALVGVQPAKQAAGVKMSAENMQINLSLDGMSGMDVLRLAEALND